MQQTPFPPLGQTNPAFPGTYPAPFLLSSSRDILCTVDEGALAWQGRCREAPPWPARWPVFHTAHQPYVSLACVLLSDVCPWSAVPQDNPPPPASRRRPLWARSGVGQATQLEQILSFWAPVRFGAPLVEMSLLLLSLRAKPYICVSFAL